MLKKGFRAWVVLGVEGFRVVKGFRAIAALEIWVKGLDLKPFVRGCAVTRAALLQGDGCSGREKPAVKGF